MTSLMCLHSSVCLSIHAEMYIQIIFYSKMCVFLIFFFCIFFRAMILKYVFFLPKTDRVSYLDTTLAKTNPCKLNFRSDTFRKQFCHGSTIATYYVVLYILHYKYPPPKGNGNTSRHFPKAVIVSV